jgi:hypothetical protein
MPDSSTVCGPPIVFGAMQPVDLGRAEECYADAAAEMRRTADYLDRTSRHLRARRLPEAQDALMRAMNGLWRIFTSIDDAAGATP